MLQLETIDSPLELSPESAVAAQAGSADLGASVVAEVGPVDEKAAMIEPVHHFVAERVFEVRFGKDAVRADQNGGVASRFRRKRRGEAARY